jgi:hypothetical protein
MRSDQMPRPSAPPHSEDVTTPKRNEAVAWYTDGHENDKSATTWDPVVAARWEAKGWPVYSLHKGIDYCALEARIFALQGEVSRLRDALLHVRAIAQSINDDPDEATNESCDILDHIDALNLEPPADAPL